MVRFVEADDNATFLEGLLDDEEEDEDNSDVLALKEGARLLNRGKVMNKENVMVSALYSPHRYLCVLTLSSCCGCGGFKKKIVYAPFRSVGCQLPQASNGPLPPRAPNSRVRQARKWGACRRRHL